MGQNKETVYSDSTEYEGLVNEQDGGQAFQVRFFIESAERDWADVTLLTFDPTTREFEFLLHATHENQCMVHHKVRITRYACTRLTRACLP